MNANNNFQFTTLRHFFRYNYIFAFTLELIQYEVVPIGT